MTISTSSVQQRDQDHFGNFNSAAVDAASGAHFRERYRILIFDMLHECCIWRQETTARFSFSVPDGVAVMLDKDKESTGKSRSSLIAEYIEQFYKGKTQLAEDVNAVQRVKSEHEKRVQHLIAKREAEVQQIKADCDAILFEDHDKKVALGVIDTDSPDVESVEVVKNRIKRGVEVFGDDMWVNPDCGLRLQTREIAFHK
jgi:metal-responsive CopG/Arc/MetJ family transcriptional regulator